MLNCKRPGTLGKDEEAARSGKTGLSLGGWEKYRLWRHLRKWVQCEQSGRAGKVQKGYL